MLELKKIVKNFPSGRSGEIKPILNGLSFKLDNEKSVAIEGRSGSGKTTFLRIISGLDSDYGGDYTFEQKNMNSKSSDSRAFFRREKLGIITQQFNLLEDRNVYENIVISLSHSILSRSEKKQKVNEVLRYVGLEKYGKKSINQLSGGEMQRIAIARAIVKNPSLIIADEPTGSLDETTRDEMLELFKKMMDDGKKFIIVTHDKDVSCICDKVYTLHRGILKES